MPDFRRPWADAGLLTDVAAGRPPHALARDVGTRPPHVACAHVGVSQPAGEKRPSARTPAGPGPRRSVAARPIAQARTRSRLICERRACAYQLRKPGQADRHIALTSEPSTARHAGGPPDRWLGWSDSACCLPSLQVRPRNADFAMALYGLLG